MKFVARVMLEAKKNGIGDDTVLRTLISILKKTALPFVPKILLKI